ncbi:transcriptional regulator, MarR family [Methylotenera versatilis 301]|uniref:Transcriptional regulator, MarR family n=2 Tax=Methylotenera TaxID=359407 RepID=D7DJF3_METV0|nr:transcriptional regulator, MarR family [Methylotenera versatilis 301]
MKCTSNSPLAGLPDDLLLSLDQQLCFALYSASLSMTKVYKPLLAQFKLTYPQYLVLLVLWEQDALTVNTLGQRLFLDSGTLTPLLKRLEKVGFISKQRALDDERRVIVTLTSAGKKLRDQALQVPIQVSCNTGCSLPEMRALHHQLIKLRISLGKH